MNTLEHAQLLNVLRQSGSFNDAEPLYCSVRRLTDERNSERARAERFKVQVQQFSTLTTTQAERIRALENEIKRLSNPPGSFIGWRTTYDASPAPAPLPAVPPPPPPPAPDTSRMGRQRRELRRLNAAQRVLRMEADLTARKHEEAVEEVIRLRRQVRVLETSK